MPFRITRNYQGVHVVVIVAAGGSDGVRCRRSVGRRTALVLQKAAPCKLGIEAGKQLTAGNRLARRREHEAAAVLAIFFGGLSEQEVLEEVHAGTAKIEA